MNNRHSTAFLCTANTELYFSMAARGTDWETRV